MKDWNDAHRAGVSALKVADAAWARSAPDSEPIRESLGGGLILRCAADIVMKPVEWIWPGRIALGKQTLLAGEAGLGKSQVMISITAAITTGGEWPCGEGRAPQGSVILLSAEDGAEDTIKPRLVAAGADLSRVYILDAVRTEDGQGRRSFSLQTDLAALETTIKRMGGAKMIGIDPISSYLGNKVDSHVNAAVRSVLEPIGSMAERTGVSILSITHPPKGANTSAINSFIGSVAFVAAARAAFMAARDESDPNRVLLLPVKNNLAPLGQGLAFRLNQTIVSTQGQGIVSSFVNWEQNTVSISADQALAATKPDKREAMIEAKELLREMLASGPKDSKEVEDAALNGHMISRATLRRAKEELKITSTKDGLKGGWLWRLPTSLEQ